MMRDKQMYIIREMILEENGMWKKRKHVRASGGNPLITLGRQFPVRFVKLNAGVCNIYDGKGKLVDKRKDNLVEEAFK